MRTVVYAYCGADHGTYDVWHDWWVNADVAARCPGKKGLRHEPPDDAIPLVPTTALADHPPHATTAGICLGNGPFWYPADEIEQSLLVRLNDLRAGTTWERC